MAKTDRPDFIYVRLSDHAIAQLGEDAAVGVTNAHMHYQFKGDTPVEILRRPEWAHLQHDLFDGKPLFQEAEAPAAAITSESTSSEA